MRILALIIITFFGCAQTQQQNANPEITTIKLQYEDQLRIPFHWVWVTIEKKSGSIIVHSVSKPLKDSVKWNYSNIDTSFTISSSAYYKLVSLVSQINDADLKLSSVSLDDGTDLSIAYGNSDSLQKFNVSTPSYDAVKRKTIHFQEASEEILKISGIPFK